MLILTGRMWELDSLKIDIGMLDEKQKSQVMDVMQRNATLTRQDHDKHSD